MTFQDELASLINKYSKENDSGTPDFILAQFLDGVLNQWNYATQRRAKWRGESIELPALLEFERKVPLAQCRRDYKHGHHEWYDDRDNEIKDCDGKLRS